MPQTAQHIKDAQEGNWDSSLGKIIYYGGQPLPFLLNRGPSPKKIKNLEIF